MHNSYRKKSNFSSLKLNKKNQNFRLIKKRRKYKKKLRKYKKKLRKYKKKPRKYKKKPRKHKQNIKKLFKSKSR